jgi:hypothetical protein
MRNQIRKNIQSTVNSVQEFHARRECPNDSDSLRGRSPAWDRKTGDGGPWKKVDQKNRQCGGECGKWKEMQEKEK